jgi:predicted O-linked N-acetylglucosamine transferase (SPINDLY family)
MAADPRLTHAAYLFQRGRHNEAALACEAVLAADPHEVDALHLLGLVRHLQGDHASALTLLASALLRAPAVAQLHSNMVAILKALGRHREALDHAATAARLDPDSPEARNNHGVMLEGSELLGEAAGEYRAAIGLRPAYAEAHYNLGNVLRKLGRFEESVTSHRAAIRLRPGYPHAHGGLAHALADLGRLDEMVAARRAQVAAAPNSHGAHSALLYCLHYHPAQTRATLFDEHREWDRRHGRPRAARAGPHPNVRSPERRLRVWFVSPDLRRHTVTRFVGAAIERHDREAFEFYAYSDTERPDETTARLRESCRLWRDTRALSDERLAALVREDRVDVLVDLRGHGAANRLAVFAMKPAPVQISMVGYFDTTGLSAMDYRLTDAIQDPEPSADALHTERLLRVPGGCWCYTPDGDEPPVGPPPVRRNGHVTFGCLNKLIKINHAVAATWARILEAVPRSRLLVAAPGGEAAGAHLTSLGLPPGRVDVLGKVSGRSEYLDRFNAIDVALDPFPFNGITTTCDGLWMGVPAVALCGETSVSRAGASILTNLGLPDLVTSDASSYCNAAVSLATDTHRLAALRRSLREQFRWSPLGDNVRFTSALQTSFRQAWRAWCSWSGSSRHGTDLAGGPDADSPR